MHSLRSKVLFFVITLLVTVSASKESHAEISIGAYGSLGSIKDSNASISPVQAMSLGAYLLPSYPLISLMSIGLYGEYDFVGQTTTPSSVGGYNKGFKGYLAGGALVFSTDLFRLTGAYSFLGKGVLNKKTSAGLETSLESPKGLHFILGIRMLPNIFLDLGYAKIKHDVFVGGTSSFQTRTMEEYRLGCSLNF